MARKIADTLFHFSGSALSFMHLYEVDFAAASGVAYVPPERGDFRRIVPLRTIQLLQDVPHLIHTYQTSIAYIRLPSNQLGTDETGNDAGNGRVIRFKNEGTGSIIIANSLGVVLVTVPPLYSVNVQSSENQDWDTYGLSNENPNALPISVIGFSRGSGVSEGGYLNIGDSISSDSGYPIIATTYVTAMYVTNGKIMATGRSATFRLQRRTGVSTFVDIPGTDVTIPQNQYNAQITGLMVKIAAGSEVACYRIPGGGGNTGGVVFYCSTI
jgi:hypothetical protein